MYITQIPGLGCFYKERTLDRLVRHKERQGKHLPSPEPCMPPSQPLPSPHLPRPPILKSASHPRFRSRSFAQLSLVLSPLEKVSFTISALPHAGQSFLLKCACYELKACTANMHMSSLNKMLATPRARSASKHPLAPTMHMPSKGHHTSDVRWWVLCRSFAPLFAATKSTLEGR